MTKGNKVVAVIVGILFCLVLGYRDALQAEETLVILTTADLQSQILPYKVKKDGREQFVGGLERVRTVYQRFRKAYPRVVLVSTGDDLFGPFYKIFKGKPEIEGMNLAGYAVVTCGNHEFDNGVDFYFQALKEARFKVVISNLTFRGSTPQAIKSFWVQDLAGLKLGFFGLITPDLRKLTNVSPDKVEIEEDIFSLAQGLVQRLRAQGADLVVLLSHLGHELDLKVAHRVVGIDVIVGGHDHAFIHEEVTNLAGGKTIIVQAGARGSKLGVLKLQLSQGKVVSHTWEPIPLDARIPGDPLLHQRLAVYGERFAQETNKVIGRSLVDLDARKEKIRQGETNLGNLVADSWRMELKEEALVLAASGAIRGDKIYPAGEITYKTVLDILPFGNEIYEVRLTGKQLKQALEIAASAIIVPHDGCPPGQRASSGGFLQVSNLYVEIDLSQRPFCAQYLPDRSLKKLLFPGERIKKVLVRQGGRLVPLDPEGTYHVLINSWLAQGGDGYYLFLEEGIYKRNTTFTDADLLISYIKKHSPISPRLEGRIKFVSPAP